MYSPENKYFIIYGIFKGEEYFNDLWQTSKLQSKWDKSFWARGYYVATVGNITEDAIKKYIQAQSEESKRDDSEGAAF